MPTSEFNNTLLGNVDFLRPFAINLTKDAEAANDLYQETLYKALVNQEKYKTGTNIKAWLYTIMRNIFINDYRRRMKQRTIFDGSGNDYIIDGKQATVANVAESNLRIKEVKTAINQLPEIFRTPFTLYVEGYRYLEIADLLHEPLGTIKSRIHFARKLLKEQIDRG